MFKIGDVVIYHDTRLPHKGHNTQFHLFWGKLFRVVETNDIYKGMDITTVVALFDVSDGKYQDYVNSDGTCGFYNYKLDKVDDHV